MNQYYFNFISKVTIITLLGTFLSAQRLDSQDIAYNELRDIVETASRTNQKVWVEDFTGLNWPYCPSASFALDTLLRAYPATLNTIEWHSPSYTPDDSDFCLETEYSIRASMYNVGGIPHLEWNGDSSTIGGYPNGTWQGLYTNYAAIIDTFMTNQTPYTIGISGEYSGSQVNYDIELLLNDDRSPDNMYLELFVAEDSIYSYWGAIDEYHNARNVARRYITKSTSQ